MGTKCSNENLIADVDYHITMSYDGNSDFESVVYSLMTERINKYENCELELNCLVNSAPDVIIFKDAEGRWINANEDILHCLSLKGISFKGKTDLDLVSETTIQSLRDVFMTCIESDNAAWESGVPIRVQEKIPLVNGSSRVYDVTKIPLFKADGTRKGLVIVGVDVTDQVE